MANIAILFYGSMLEWYIFEFSNFKHNILNNNLEVKSWVNTQSYQFKISTSVALGFLINKTYFFDDAYVQCPPT